MVVFLSQQCPSWMQALAPLLDVDILIGPFCLHVLNFLMV
jgi:hypothetical protein